MIFETIRAFLAEQFGYDEARITPSTVILEDLEAEATDLADLVLMIEQEFAVELTDDDLQESTTVGDIARMVENRIE